MRFRSLLLLGLLAVPFAELAGHVWIVLRVPSLADYRAATSFIRSQLRDHDLVTSAPGFIDPILRWQLGDRMPLAMAGRSDDAAYDRMWVLSIRNALPPDAPRAAPELTRHFGRVSVLRYPLPASPVLFDFVQAWSDAQASITRAGVEQPCLRRSNGVPRGGGLGKGVLTPLRDRFDCDQARQLFVGAVVLEDLDNRPRRCIWQHPQGDEPITLSFPDVPLGEELVFYAGIYYEDERMRSGGPIEATISVDGAPLGQFRHVDGDGFRSLHLLTAELGKTRGRVSVAVRAHEPAGRSFCWAASTRHGPKAPHAAGVSQP